MGISQSTNDYPPKIRQSEETKTVHKLNLLYRIDLLACGKVDWTTRSLWPHPSIPYSHRGGVSPFPYDIYCKCSKTSFMNFHVYLCKVHKVKEKSPPFPPGWQYGPKKSCILGKNHVFCDFWQSVKSCTGLYGCVRDLLIIIIVLFMKMHRQFFTTL